MRLWPREFLRITGYATVDLPSKAAAIEWAMGFGDVVKVNEIEVRQMPEGDQGATPFSAKAHPCLGLHGHDGPADRRQLR